MPKRLFDLICASIGLAIASPIFLVVAILVKLEDGGPVFYWGKRIGKDGVPFRMCKFRTMVVHAEKMGGSSTADGDPRITKIGRRLRKYKLDELPQLINVVGGEMSLVGPRPQVAWAVDLYTEEERALLTVLPGITDYASVRFGNEGEILRGSHDPDRDYLEKIAPEKIRLGLEYVRHRSFWVDLKILLATVRMMMGGTPGAMIGQSKQPAVKTMQGGGTTL